MRPALKKREDDEFCNAYTWHFIHELFALAYIRELDYNGDTIVAFLVMMTLGSMCDGIEWILWKFVGAK